MSKRSCDVLGLWKKHGGRQHGPRVETLTIPLANFHAFIRDVEATADERALMESIRSVIRDEVSRNCRRGGLLFCGDKVGGS